MPRLPEPVLRHILVDALTVAVPNAIVPPSIEGIATIQLPLAPGATRSFTIAVRTITRDTRQQGQWVERLKIQLTTLQGVQHLDAILGVTIVGEEPIIVAIDPDVHIPTSGASNNVQFPESLVMEALETQSQAQHRKDATGELVRAFPSSLLVPYLLSRPAPVGAPVPPILPPATYRTYRARTRNAIFSRDVRDMFQHRCAACGVALGLVEAAHIVAHAQTGDDSLHNGLCLCPTHHTAFDVAELLSFAPDRSIWVNEAKLDVLNREGRLDGFDVVIGSMYAALLPAHVDQTANLHARHVQNLEEGHWTIFETTRTV